MRLGIIGGTSLFGTKTEFLEAADEREVDTKYGTVYLIFTADVVFIPRHGKTRNIPPHMINYKANLAAFKDLGVENIIGVTSVGSLKRDIKPRSLIVPHDYISLCSIPTFYDDELVHVTSGLDEQLRTAIIEVATDFDAAVITSGVYFQTPGPRLETRAEIDFIKNYADVIGMNMASEATLAKELGLRYANISSVDNYAHGIIAGGEGEEELDYKQIVEAAAKNREKLELLLMKLIDALQGTIQKSRDISPRRAQSTQSFKTKLK
ncbi:MAG TPA: 6-oxopurine nucleoside phosphorylase [Methanophagales archaeon]|nr:6-oxopurine nucleoside phosphorylase [Methanophagales archaeon]